MDCMFVADNPQVRHSRPSDAHCWELYIASHAQEVDLLDSRAQSAYFCYLFSSLTWNRPPSQPYCLPSPPAPFCSSRRPSAPFAISHLACSTRYPKSALHRLCARRYSRHPVGHFFFLDRAHTLQNTRGATGPFAMHSSRPYMAPTTTPASAQTRSLAKRRRLWPRVRPIAVVRPSDSVQAKLLSLQ